MWTPNADKLVMENASTMVVNDSGDGTALERRTDVDTGTATAKRELRFVDEVSINSKNIANEVDKQVNEYANMENAHADETAERMRDATADVLNLGQENAQDMIDSGEVKDGAMGINENRDGSESIILTEHLATRTQSQYQKEKDLKKQQELKKLPLTEDDAANLLTDEFRHGFDLFNPNQAKRQTPEQMEAKEQGQNIDLTQPLTGTMNVGQGGLGAGQGDTFDLQCQMVWMIPKYKHHLVQRKIYY